MRVLKDLVVGPVCWAHSAHDGSCVGPGTCRYKHMVFLPKLNLKRAGGRAVWATEGEPVLVLCNAQALQLREELYE